MHRNAIWTLDAWLDGVKSKISLFFVHVTRLTGPATREVDLGERAMPAKHQNIHGNIAPCLLAMLDDGDFSTFLSPWSLFCDANPSLGKAQMPLAGVILCCTSIPPEQRVCSLSNCYNCRVFAYAIATDRASRGCSSDGSYPQIRPHLRCHAPHRWQYRYAEIQIRRKRKARCESAHS